jgi:SCY1-like protein 1
MDLYLTRIRRYAATLPDTVQPPPGAATASGATPRMGTPANEGSSWAGWAISSFTNKLTTASGQMQAPSNGASRVTSPEPRASSVPPPVTSTTSKPSTTPLISSGLKPIPSSRSAASDPFAPPPSDQGEAEDDFDTSWGDAIDDDAADAWGAADQDATTDPFATSKSSNEPADLFDDKGEPDFSGWLSAQADAKKKGKKNPLPRGLVKTSAATSTTTAARPGLGTKSNSTGGMGLKKTLPVAKAKPVVVKKEEKVEEEEEGWGDAW